MPGYPPGYPQGVGASAARGRRGEGVSDIASPTDLLQQRFSRAFIAATNKLNPSAGLVTLADEPLVIDLDGPAAGAHWIVWALAAIGTFTARNILGAGIPTSGLFLVPRGTPVEATTDTSAANFWMPQARTGVSLPCEFKTQALAARFGIVCQWNQPGGSLIVPAGHSLRFIANVAPATAAPGPGAGSSVTLTALVTPENDN